ncbi:chemotaxis response regulator protein-glutamate methylesterase [Halorubrum sp. 48-1-W]|nr:chemotaxis response regulator protein-glutamate methylesterase [Halorubrum sp. 48-1-W]
MLVLGPVSDMSRTTDRRGGRSDAPRVVVVDDSAFMRGLIGDLLTDAGVAVVGEAGDGAEALSVVDETRPDVVTMDVEMPGMGGLEAVERLMAETPTPVLMLSAHTAEGAEVTFEALERGAVDFFSKPGGEVSTGVSQEADRLVEAVRSVADADLEAATRDRYPPNGADTGSPSAVDLDSSLTAVVGASTGGPRAVERVLSALPMADCRVLVVQHMPEAFTPRFAERLDSASAYDVREATDGARIGAGEALVAPGSSHMRVDSYRAGRLRVKLVDEHAVAGDPSVTPAVDVTMRSAARTVSDPLVGVVLTGMGDDGAVGIRAMADAGARTVAQSEDTCVVYGMPKRAVGTGAVDSVCDLDDVAGAILGGEA